MIKRLIYRYEAYWLNGYNIYINFILKIIRIFKVKNGCNCKYEITHNKPIILHVCG